MTFIATDGHDATLWLDRPDHPLGPEALVRECDVDRRVWTLLEAASSIGEHQVRVWTSGYGGHRTYCSCGVNEDYAEHLLAIFNIDDQQEERR